MAEVFQATANTGLAEALRAAARGDYRHLPTGTDPASEAARQLIVALRSDALERLDHAVAVSMKSNDAAIEAAWALNETNSLGEEVQASATAAEQFSSSISRIEEEARAVVEELGDMGGITEKGRSVAAKAADQMTDLTDRISAADTRMESLLEAFEVIAGFVEKIDMLAQQSNLLAINAGVEAARAGTAGRSFGIVADEVRELSSATAAFTQDIQRAIDTMRGETCAVQKAVAQGADAARSGASAVKELRASMDEIDAAAATASQRMGALNAPLAEQTAAAAELARAAASIDSSATKSIKRLSHVTGKIDESLQEVSTELTKLAAIEAPGKTLRLAKSDHVIWKKKLADMFAGRVALAEHELKSHTHCRLGCWYYGDKARALGGHPTFQALEDPHRRVHEAGIRAAGLHARGDVPAALEAYGAMERAPLVVIDLLDALISEQKQALSAAE